MHPPTPSAISRTTNPSRRATRTPSPSRRAPRELVRHGHSHGMPHSLASPRLRRESLQRSHLTTALDEHAGHSIREVPDSPLGPPPRGPPSATAYISYRQAHPAAAAAAPPPGPPPHRPSEADDAVAGAPHGRNGGAASKARGAPQPEYLVALPRLPALDAPTSPSAFLHLHAHPPNAPRSPHSPKTVRHGPPPSPAPASQGHHLPAALVPASPTSATHLGARPSSQLSPGQPGALPLEPPAPPLRRRTLQPRVPAPHSAQAWTPGPPP